MLNSWQSIHNALIEITRPLIIGQARSGGLRVGEELEIVS
jgi:hypothetical protein